MSASSPSHVLIEPSDARDLLARLGEIPDPRRGGGRVHPVGYVLAVTVVAFTCPAFAHLVGAAAWAAAASREVLLMLGARPEPLTGRVRPPSEATIRRVVCGVDPDTVEAVFTSWLTAWRQARTAGTAGEGLRGVAVDGKSMRGARDACGVMPHLLAAATHDTPTVLAQVKVAGKTSEIASTPALLDRLSKTGQLTEDTVVTLDALHTIRDTARAIREAGGHYLMTVKANTPKLMHAIDQHLTNPDVAVHEDNSTARGHGRTEQRILRAAALQQAGAVGEVEFPDAAQVMRIVRYRGGLDAQRTGKEVVHAITSLPPERADSGVLAGLLRGHWSIENSIHHVRDVTFGEDAHRARTGNAPAVLATIRNIITAAIRLSGATNIAAARRVASTNIHTAINWFTVPTEPDESPL